MYITISKDDITLDPGSEVILRYRTWDDYEQLLSIRQDRPLPKIYFNAITQEIKLMAPLPAHGKKIDVLRDLVKVLLRREHRDWECFDPITLKKLERAGVEPDACFYIENRLAILGKEKIDLSVDPPPDLAIEVDVTSTTNPQDYQAIAIPELWIYRQGELLIYVFDGQKYQNSTRSPTFVNIDVKNLLPKYVEMAWSNGSSVALRQFEQDLM